MIRTVPRIGGGHRWRRPTRRCSSGATPRFCAGWMCCAGCAPRGWSRLFVILGPSGAGKSSFLRAGLLPRLRRDDRRFLPAADRAPGDGRCSPASLASPTRSISCVAELGFARPMLGEIKNACHHEQVECLRGWLEEARQAARDRLLDVPAEQPAPTLVLPVDQAEELFNADAGTRGPTLPGAAGLPGRSMRPGSTPAMIVAVTIRADRYEPLQIAPELAGVKTAVFDELRPLPARRVHRGHHRPGPARHRSRAAAHDRTGAGGAAAGGDRRRG